MDLKFIPTEFLLSTDHWFSAETIAETQALPLIAARLQGDGLLTLALQKAYDLPSSVELRRQADWVDEQGGIGLRRDVLIKSGEIVRVVAATLMPKSIITRHPWIATMGNNPLGEMMGKNARYQRGTFEFSQLKAEMVFPAPSDPALLLWARRYRFYLAEDFLTVTEIFLPGVLEHLGTAI
ncbi:MAG: chorismate lyase [Acidobacteria bacterium]|nr:chorismate lyase [Acidobacteriota bacterium]